MGGASESDTGSATMDHVELIDGLNRDLAQELATICRSIQQAALAKGPAASDLRIFLKVEVVDDVFHALFLADKIAELGGTPTAAPAPFKTLTDPKAMLEYDLEMERRAIKQYTERLHEADGAWALALKTRLERIIVDETDHEKRLLRMLGKQDEESSEGPLTASPPR
jgi:bacterioferritin